MEYTTRFIVIYVSVYNNTCMYLKKKREKHIIIFSIYFLIFFIDPRGNKMVDRLGLDITHENPAVSGLSCKVCGKRPRLPTLPANVPKSKRK